MTPAADAVPDRPVLYRGKNQDRVDALLSGYDAWRRQRVDMTGSGGGTVLGRLVRIARLARREEKLPPAAFNVYPDDLMLEVGRIIKALPPDEQDGRMIRQVVWEQYCGPQWWSQKQKAERVGVTDRWYRQLLTYGKIMVDRKVDWHRICIAPPADQFYSWFIHD